MNRHERIMATRKLPASINLKHVDQIFAAYEASAKREARSNFQLLDPRDAQKRAAHSASKR